METFNKLVNSMKVYMYLYIIEAANLPPRDEFSHSDPYIVIRAGNRVLDLSEEFKEDETNPQFFRKVRMLL